MSCASDILHRISAIEVHVFSYGNHLNRIYRFVVTRINGVITPAFGFHCVVLFFGTLGGDAGILAGEFNFVNH